VHYRSRDTEANQTVDAIREMGAGAVAIGGDLTDLDTAAGIPPWATNTQPATLPAVPTNERLSFAVDQFTGSGQGHRGT
jgi:hypothetical protein